MKVQGSILIERSRETIFSFVASMPFLQKWIAPYRVEKYEITPKSHYREVHHASHYLDLHQISEGPWRVGTTFKQSNKSRYYPLEATIKIISYEPPTTFTLQSSTKMDISHITYIFQGTGNGGTKATLIWEQILYDWRFKWLGLIAVLVARNKLPGSPQYMQRLKSYLENQC